MDRTRKVNIADMHYDYDYDNDKNQDTNLVLQIAFEMHEFMGWELLDEWNHFWHEHIAYINRLHIMYHIGNLYKPQWLPQKLLEHDPF